MLIYDEYDTHRQNAATVGARREEMYDSHERRKTVLAGRASSRAHTQRACLPRTEQARGKYLNDENMLISEPIR
jgi:hypothetical protein